MNPSPLFSRSPARALACAIASAFLLPDSGGGAANDLRLTSITRNGDCTTLTWASRPAEFYTVFWTDRLGPDAFWRVAEVNVPSGGTNTTWTEGDCGSMALMAGGGGSSSQGAELSETELSQRRAEIEARAKANARYLWRQLQEAQKALEKSRSQGGGGLPTLSGDGPPDPGSGNGGGNPPSVARFYRVARTAVAGRVQQLGYGAATFGGLDHVIAVSAGPRDPWPHSLALYTNGTVEAWGNNVYLQALVPTNLTDVVALAAGGRHSVALKRDGTVVLWGDNKLGQITNAPPDLTNVVAVAAGLWHTMALRRDGTVAVWGDLYIKHASNAVPAGLSNVTAIAAGPRHCLALRSDGRVVAWGFTHPGLFDNFLPTNVPPTLSNVVAIAAGMEHNQALLRNGSVVVWGRTNLAWLNAPTNLGPVAGLAAGWHFGLALRSNSTVTGWALAPDQGGLTNVVALSAGAVHALAISTNGGGVPLILHQPNAMAAPVGGETDTEVQAVSTLPLAYQWYRGTTVLTGRTNATLTLTNVQESDAGPYRVLVSTSAGAVWSSNATLTIIHPPVILGQEPELNLRRPQTEGVGAELRVSATSEASMFYEWYHDGQRVFGGLIDRPGGNGLGLQFANLAVEGAYYCVVTNVAGRTTSAVWQVSITLTGEATGWGDNQYGQLDNPRHETNLVAIAAGAYHTLGLRENGTVVAWGYNAHGQTNVPAGLSNVVAVAAGNVHSVALRENGTARTWGGNTYGQTNVPASATNLVAVAAGAFHTLGLRRNGTVMGWGATNFGALNFPANLTNVAAVAAGDGLSYALLSNGTVRAWGSGGFGAVSIPSSLTNVAQIAAGHTHLLALRSNGTVTAVAPLDSGWGETTIPAGLSNVLQVSGGYMFSAALLNTGTARAWGRHDYGQTNVPGGLGDVKQVSAGGLHCVSLAYSPILNYPVVPSRDLLLICNTNLADSVAVMNYYRTNRPGVATANVLGLGGPTNLLERFTNFATMSNQLIWPVRQWLDAHPTKRPAYAILFYGVPANYGMRDSTLGSASHFLSLLDPIRGLRSTHINMRTPTDCFAYVDKLRYFGTNYSPGRIYISPRSAGYGNSTHYFDDIRSDDFPNLHPGFEAMQGVLAHGASSNSIVFTTGLYPRLVYPYQATNVVSYMCWGYHGALGENYPTNGTVLLHGTSSWYLGQSIESYNGHWFPPYYQTSFHQWFSSGAFLGTNYSFTPVGFVSHTDEPAFFGVSDRYTYFGLWEAGRHFGTAAWVSRRTPFFQAIGDPFVRK